MINRTSKPIAMIIGLLLLTGRLWGATGEAPVALAPSDYTTIRGKVLAWANGGKPVPGVNREQVLAERWPETAAQSGADVWWDQALQTFAALNPDVKKFMDTLQRGSGTLSTAQTEILFQKEQGNFFAANLRLHYVRWLTQRGDCEAGMEVLQQVDPSEVISPAAYLFYKATCEKQLLKQKEGLKTLEALLALSPANTPQRYLQSARLMKVELERIKPNSLEEISWMMNDVERRLKLTQTGKKTQLLEEQIVKNLDKLIKQMEDQQNSSSQASSAGGQAKPGAQTPAAESRLKGSIAPGDVDSRKLAPGDSWGNLSEKERTR
ncbi:MAG: hypothetical protein U0903_07600 [Planctomycetales bacterium]